MKSKNKLVTIFGFIVAIVLVMFTFQGVQWSVLKAQVFSLNPMATLLMIALSLAGLFGRGCRWWLLLARPVKPPEFWAIQRAMAVSYAVGNVLSRLAEVVRIAIGCAETKRPAGEMTATVVVDRLIMDGSAFGFMLLLALGWNREKLVNLLPEAIPFITLFMIVLLVGCLGLLLLAFRPDWIIRLMKWMRIDRIPTLGALGLQWVVQFHAGLQVFAKPKYLLASLVTNVVVWLLPFVYFLVALNAFGVESSMMDAWFIFSLTVVGVLIPSPGGVGSYHFMVTLGLTHWMGLPQDLSVAIALVTHGINYLVLFCVGLPAWWLSRKAVIDHKSSAQVVQ